MAARTTVTVVPMGDADTFNDRLAEAEHDGRTTLAELLREQPALGLQPLQPLLDTPVVHLSVQVGRAAPDQAVYLPPGVLPAASAPAGAAAEPEDALALPAAGEPPRPEDRHPEVIDDATAVRIAYDEEIQNAVQFLQADLSVLVRCEKLLVEHLALEVAGRCGRQVYTVPAEAATARRPADATGGRRQQILIELQAAVRDCGKRDMILVAHLDLLAGGSDATLGAEARELIDVLYERSKVVLLAFVDPSLVIPEVLANRFAVRIDVEILPKDVMSETGKPMPTGMALVTRAEAERFDRFDAIQLHKHIAGLSAVRLRHAMIYAGRAHPSGGDFQDLLNVLRRFKANTTASSFEVPNVSLDDIGGYREVREELEAAITLLNEPDKIPKKYRSELVPKGFIFFGPPGTGKTLFAKAVATKMNATILVVSGPEVTDMYVGESERKIREIFAEARRNAPSVIVFDEIDSIAGRRSGGQDGGSRAGNAIVAQLLTEMDGFRPDVPVLIIGTTNRLDIIDDALLRPSRFRPIAIGLPNPEARREIATKHADHFEIDVSPMLLDRIGDVTHGMNGDQIRSIFRDARAHQLLNDPHGVVRPADLGTVVGRLRRGEHTKDQSTAATPPVRPGPAAGSTGDDVTVVLYVPPAEAAAEPELETSA
ncbi:ATP-binding protein [Dactylosporangium sp. NPDC000244]|uniref:ATP-binding protein n=1 Tax=Dactylosporangium sp. NPDC000244 TaxID=3154365 RepID=UPI00333269D4